MRHSFAPYVQFTNQHWSGKICLLGSHLYWSCNIYCQLGRATRMCPNAQGKVHSRAEPAQPVLLPRSH